MSEGKRLVQAFQKLDCPLARDLTGTSFDHLFEDATVQEFLKEFCVKVEIGELVPLNDLELTTLQQMNMAGIDLDDDILRRAFGMKEGILLGSSESRHFEGVVKELEDDIAEIENYKIDLSAKCQLLRNKEKLFDEEATRIKRMMSHEQKCIHEILLQGRSKKIEVMRTLLKTKKVIKKLNDRCNNGVWKSRTNDASIKSLSQLDLGNYLQLERSVLLQVHLYCADRLCKSADVGDDVICGIGDWCRDLTTLRNCLTESKSLSLVMAAAVRAKENSLQIFQKHFYKEPSKEIYFASLRRKVKTLEMACDLLKKELDTLLNDRLPRFVARNTRNSINTILIANYYLKQKRLRHLTLLTKKAKKVLLLQHARLMTVEGILQQEYKEQVEIFKKIETILDYLSHESTSVNCRKDFIHEALRNSTANEEGSVDVNLRKLTPWLSGDSYNQIENIRQQKQQQEAQELGCANWQEIKFLVSRMEGILRQMNEMFLMTRNSESKAHEPLDSLSKKSHILEELVSDIGVMVASKNKPYFLKKTYSF